MRRLLQQVRRHAGQLEGWPAWGEQVQGSQDSGTLQVPPISTWYLSPTPCKTAHCALSPVPCPRAFAELGPINIYQIFADICLPK